MENKIREELDLIIKNNTYLIDKGVDTFDSNEAVPQLLNLITESNKEYAIEQFEWLLKHGHGGGNWRRLVNSGIEHLRSKIKGGKDE